jgi:hypothetical protein
MPTASKPVLLWLIISQAIYLLSLLPWLAMAGLAFMAFDAPGSTEQAGPWLFAGSIWAYPLLPLVCSIAAWLLYRGEHMRGAVIATTAPMVLVALAGLVLVMLAART